MAFLGYRQAPSSSISSILGDALEQSLTQSLQNREFNKVYKNNQNLLEGLGIRKDIANPLSRNAPEEIFKFLKQFDGLDIGNPAPTQNPLDLLGQLLSSDKQLTNNQQFQPQQAQNNQQFQPNQQLFEQQPTTNNNAIKQLFDAYPQLQNKISPEQLGQLIQNQVQQQALQGKPQAVIAPKIQSKAQADAERAARIQQLKEATELKKFEAKEELENRKESKKYLAQLNKEAKVAKENDMRLDRMSELIKTGKLSSPLFHNTLKTLSHGLWGVGLDLHFLESPESQEFTKLSSDMIKGIKDIFGERVTNLDVESFLKTIPSLSQSNEGKQRIIRNLKISNQANKLKESTAKKIIKENGNNVPADLELLVEEQVNPKLDALAAKFIKNAEPKQKSKKTEKPIDTIFNGIGLNKLSLLD